MTDASPVARAAELAALGHHAPLDGAARERLHAAATDDDDPRVRTAALGALVRAAPDTAVDDVLGGFADRAVAVRRRAAELATGVPPDDRVVRALLDLLDDGDVTVIEAAAWALGEMGDAARCAGAVPGLVIVAREHHDALAREAAVAALGALGDRDALPAILDACRDKPAVRRRAVLSLAPFDGPEVDAALDAALDDRDWQVRQAAEDLRGD